MNELLDKFERLFSVRPVASSPKTWQVGERHLRLWHIRDLIEQKEAEEKEATDQPERNP